MESVSNEKRVILVVGPRASRVARRRGTCWSGVSLYVR